MQRGVGWLLCSCLVLSAALSAGRADSRKDEPAKKVISYYREVRPIFQLRCQGCHQPAKAEGNYMMTEYKLLFERGRSGEPGIVPGHPEKSRVMQLIVSHEGKPPAMPRNQDPLSPEQVELIRQWIAQGAPDDTPASARTALVDESHPPIYELPPVINAVRFSPDGHFLAISGYHEILLHRADGSQLVARLIGQAERIQSLAFSPDGRYLAASGGTPGQFGEVQVWELRQETRDLSLWVTALTHWTGGTLAVPLPGASRVACSTAVALDLPRDLGVVPTGILRGYKLRLAVPVSYDTVYGVSWSPDGKLLAFGCADNSLRAIEVATGKQVLYQGAHEDWVLDTAFSTDGSHLVSVSRDMSMKLTEVATQRFVDNITSITPGALKGGLATVARHPTKDIVVTGGSDGEPKLYQIYRTKARQIGDDFNLIRRFDRLPGRIYSAEFSPEGGRIVVGASSYGTGEIRVYDAQSGKLLWRFDQAGPVYSVCFDPQGRVVAAGGFDGIVRLLDADSGKLIKAFVPVPLTNNRAAQDKP
ncbi:MAG: c-type cytochrome domain-containing protein [Gemmatales bacterium]|nr:PQQ-binding-like beta-propeller repeat protein [Gemmatales bacterium]MDW7994087.1 c-type cytochrome domain-containing protein [Gemmatales bacterium]